MSSNGRGCCRRRGSSPPPAPACAITRSGTPSELPWSATAPKTRPGNSTRPGSSSTTCGATSAYWKNRTEAIPPRRVQDLAVLKSLLVDARKRDKECEEALVKVRQERERLENNRKQREQLDCEYLAKAKESETQSMLAQLLGREHLQLFLVRQAEREVVHYANAVLDRLSGGQLYLRLSGEGDSAKALELEAYNRVTGEQPISVAFLSGSQKFRVAVSLALGIGQYASRQHRPIESVIIDEGFGCLDRHGRQVMIQELQNLRGQMRCILLVSHQEEFAEAFADGYHFELEGGATRVRRFQK